MNLDKPSGPTSHDIVARVRRLLGVRQVGHAGTLDPMATGVLVVAVGPATRLLSHLGDQSKEYVAEILLGRTTNSQDVTGATLSETPASYLDRAAVENAAARFRGPILQVPPMISAVKHQGKRLYQLARLGQTVDRPARPVTVDDLEIEDFWPGDPARARVRIRCSGGFYVRTLCADIGEVLGCGGCMAALRRTAVGSLRVEDAITLDQLAERGAGALLPPATAVAHIPSVQVSPTDAERVEHGNYIERDRDEAHPEQGSVRLELENGRLLALARTLDRGDKVRFQPFLVLADRQ